jgi:cytochrome c biogenesis protein CcmG, thiol:disulfide interchange protein DsbE
VKLRPLPILICAAGAALIGLLVYGLSAQSPSRTIDELLARGQQPVAPDAALALPRLGTSGKSSLAQLRGKVVLLNFWASWCVPCKEEAGLLDGAQAQLQRANATVLGVTYLDVSPDAESFVRENRVTYPNLRDTNGDFAHAYGTSQVPESFIVDRRGRIVAVSRGEIGKSFVARAIEVARGT